MIAPIEKHDPTQDFSDSVIAPVSSGDASDSNLNNAGDSHPMAHPWQKLMIFAAKLKFGDVVKSKFVDDVPRFH